MQVTLCNGRIWFIDRKLKRELDILIDDVIASEMDLFIVMDGEEGSGKSYGSRGLGMYILTRLREKGIIDVDFTPENIHFRQAEYFNASKFGNKFEIIVLDEGRGALGRAKNKKLLEVIDWVSRCRFKRQFHIINVPAYHDLSPYISEWRNKAVIHFKKSYYKNQDGYKLRHGEFKLYCDLEGLRFHSRFRDYKYPNNHDAWAYWCSKEVFTPEQVEHYNAKKEYYAVLPNDADAEKFVFEKKLVPPRPPVIYTTTNKDTNKDTNNRGLLHGLL